MDIWVKEKNTRWSFLSFCKNFKAPLKWCIVLSTNFRDWFEGLSYIITDNSFRKEWHFSLSVCSLVKDILSYVFNFWLQVMYIKSKLTYSHHFITKCARGNQNARQYFGTLVSLYQGPAGRRTKTIYEDKFYNVCYYISR